MNQAFYKNYKEQLDTIKKVWGKPLTLTEKILYTHFFHGFKGAHRKGTDYVQLKPDRVTMQDATAQMAILQFITAGKERVSIPTSVHCDHLIRAQTGASEDLNRAREEHKEVYDFLQSASEKYGMHFWKPGAGIIHQVVLENYAFPGGLIIGTDSHTPNGAGLGMLAIGVGGADAVDVMVGMPWEVLFPKVLGVKLTGKLDGWISSKDIILKLAGILTVKGGTGYIIEYFGEGAESISCTGKGTIGNMGAEIGATTSTFPYDERMKRYLVANNREPLVRILEEIPTYLQPDPEVLEQPDEYYDKVIEINLDTLEPHLNGPFSPDLAHPISEMKKAMEEEHYPEDISVALIGSCTNSSYEDIDRCVSLIQQAQAKGLKAAIPFLITPGSEQIRSTIERDGLLQVLTEFGGTVLANACGPCIGMWKRLDIKEGERNSIVNSFNRNFARRNDGNPDTQAFVASPEIVTALAMSGKLSFNPVTDSLFDSEGNPFQLEPPTGKELPNMDFTRYSEGCIIPPLDGSHLNVVVDQTSDRIQLLEPFPAWDGNELENMVVLIKTQGKCTTDHISMAGPWLKYRGHLDHISRNMFLGAVNAYNGESGSVKNLLSETYEEPHLVARAYKQKGIGWVVFGEENYGEGSSREHAAMEPRFLGGKAIIVKSFARIHETNLKKQGMLPLTFVNPDDYNKVREDDKVSLYGLRQFAPDRPLTLTLLHSDGSEDQFEVNHSFSLGQIEWFKAGSALNRIRK